MPVSIFLVDFCMSGSKKAMYCHIKRLYNGYTKISIMYVD